MKNNQKFWNEFLNHPMSDDFLSSTRIEEGILYMLIPEQQAFANKLKRSFPEFSKRSFHECFHYGLDPIGILWDYANKHDMSQELKNRIKNF